jgi:hypothetical protein
MTHSTTASPLMRAPAKEAWWLLVVLLGILGSRLLFVESSPSSWDASSFYLAATDFNIAADRPHLPGYYLHVELIRFFRVFLQPMAANVAPSLMWSTLCGVPLFALVRRRLSLSDALLCVIFLAANPMLWFYGCVSEIYAFDAFFSLSILYLALRPRLTPVLFVAMALGAGVRQSSAVLLMPVVIWCVAGQVRSHALPYSRLVLSLLLGMISLALWGVPFIAACGGIRGYLELYTTHPPGAVVSAASNAVSMMQYGVYAFAVSCALLLWQRRADNGSRGDSSVSRPVILLWVLPALAMFLFTTYTKGYFLLIVAAPVLAMAHSNSSQPRKTSSPSQHSSSQAQQSLSQTGRLFGMGILAHAAVFLVVPHLMPGLDLVLAPKHGVSKWQKAAQRVTSVFSMTRSRLLHERTYMDDTDSLLTRYAVSAGGAAASVFVDPAYPLTARALQPRHPGTELCMLYTHATNALLVHHDISQKQEQGVAARLKRSVILSTASVCALQPMLKVLEQRNGLVLAVVNSDSAYSTSANSTAAALATWYAELFER